MAVQIRVSEKTQQHQECQRRPQKLSCGDLLRFSVHCITGAVVLLGVILHCMLFEWFLAGQVRIVVAEKRSWRLCSVY